MPIFPSTRYAPARTSTFYRRTLHTHPFLSFGLPFILTMVAGSFFLTPATAVRYEKHDRKTHMLDREEALGLARSREERRTQQRPRDVREEYARLGGLSVASAGDLEVEPAKSYAPAGGGGGMGLGASDGGRRERRLKREREKVDWMARMAKKAEELGEREWEPKRVERLEGEPDGTLT